MVLSWFIKLLYIRFLSWKAVHFDSLRGSEAWHTLQTIIYVFVLAITPIDSEKSARHGGCPQWVRSRSPPGFLLFWYIDPRKVTRPSEPSDLKVVAVVSVILQGFVIDDVDDRGSENSGVLSNP